MRAQPADIATQQGRNTCNDGHVFLEKLEHRPQQPLSHLSIPAPLSGGRDRLSCGPAVRGDLFLDPFSAIIRVAGVSQDSLCVRLFSQTTLGAVVAGQTGSDRDRRAALSLRAPAG